MFTVSGAVSAMLTRPLFDVALTGCFAIAGGVVTFEIGPHLGTVLTALINAGGAGFMAWHVRRGFVARREKQVDAILRQRKQSVRGKTSSRQKPTSKKS